MLDAAGLPEKAEAFAAEDVDLECLLEAHGAGDLMDLLKEVGLNVRQRMKVKRALG